MSGWTDWLRVKIVLLLLKIPIVWGKGDRKKVASMIRKEWGDMHRSYDRNNVKDKKEGGCFGKSKYQN